MNPAANGHARLLLSFATRSPRLHLKIWRIRGFEKTISFDLLGTVQEREDRLSLDWSSVGGPPRLGMPGVEFYTAKSYIRQARPEGGWRMIIGDASRRHKEVCAKLLPRVLVGKSRQELRALGEQIAEQLSVGQQGGGAEAS